jgi:hypothetical protein
MNLPSFPHIGIFQSSPANDRFPRIDQSLMHCRACSHIQLQRFVDPKALYDESFTHRTSASPSATTSSQAFAEFIRQVASGRRFERLIEIGCNDALLLKQLSPICNEAIGVDPVLRGNEAAFLSESRESGGGAIRCIGDFIENVDVEAQLGGRPDLIVSAFVFEHLADPRHVIRTLLDIASDDALFCIKVPGTDMLLENCRFDQISHQHYQQWTLATFVETIRQAGGHYLTHHIFRDVWGAMMVAFRKVPTNVALPAFRRASLEFVKGRKAIFDEHLALARKTIIGASARRTYGFGAAQNFPVLAYFWNDDVSFLDAIIDDNPARQDRFYPDIPVPIVGPQTAIGIEGSNIVVTGPDYGRALVRRASELNPHQIIVPFAAI